MSDAQFRSNAPARDDDSDSFYIDDDGFGCKASSTNKKKAKTKTPKTPKKKTTSKATHVMSSATSDLVYNKGGRGVSRSKSVDTFGFNDWDPEADKCVASSQAVNSTVLMMNTSKVSRCDIDWFSEAESEAENSPTQGEDKKKKIKKKVDKKRREKIEEKRNGQPMAFKADPLSLCASSFHTGGDDTDVSSDEDIDDPLSLCRKDKVGKDAVPQTPSKGSKDKVGKDAVLQTPSKGGTDKVESRLSRGPRTVPETPTRSSRRQSLAMDNSQKSPVKRRQTLGIGMKHHNDEEEDAGGRRSERRESVHRRRGQSVKPNKDEKESDSAGKDARGRDSAVRDRDRSRSRSCVRDRSRSRSRRSCTRGAAARPAAEKSMLGPSHVADDDGDGGEEDIDALFNQAHVEERQSILDASRKGPIRSLIAHGASDEITTEELQAKAARRRTSISYLPSALNGNGKGKTLDDMFAVEKKKIDRRPSLGGSASVHGCRVHSSHINEKRASSASSVPGDSVAKTKSKKKTRTTVAPRQRSTPVTDLNVRVRADDDLAESPPTQRGQLYSQSSSATMGGLLEKKSIAGCALNDNGIVIPLLEEKVKKSVFAVAAAATKGLTRKVASVKL